MLEDKVAILVRELLLSFLFLLLEFVELVKHRPVGLLFLDVYIEWKRLPSLVVVHQIREAPRYESLACRLVQANVEDLPEVVRLQGPCSLVPLAGVVAGVAPDVDLGDVYVDAKVVVAFHVFVDAVPEVEVVVVRGNMRLHTNTMDRTTTLFQIFNQVIHKVGFPFLKPIG